MTLPSPKWPGVREPITAGFMYTAQEMQAYRNQALDEAYKAATERAAKICEELADDLSRQWKAGRKTSTHLEGQSDGAFDCATAIRKTKESEC